VTSYSIGPEATGDKVVTRVFGGRGGEPRDVPWLVRGLGSSLVVRDEAGRLLLTGDRGAAEELAPAECRARLLHADDARNTLTWTCEAGPHRGQIRTRAPDGAVRVFGKGAGTCGCGPDHRPGRYVSVGDGVLDTEARTSPRRAAWSPSPPSSSTSPRAGSSGGPRRSRSP
jgi:hypothetical protein